MVSLHSCGWTVSMASMCNCGTMGSRSMVCGISCMQGNSSMGRSVRGGSTCGTLGWAEAAAARPCLSSPSSSLSSLATTRASSERSSLASSGLSRRRRIASELAGEL